MNGIRRLAGGVLVALALGAGVTASDAASQKSVLSAAGEREFGTGGYPVETVELAKKQGIDYTRLARAAGKGDVNALRRLMRLRDTDACTSEGHSAVLGELLRRVGDAKFAQAVAQEPLSVRARVKSFVLYDTGLSERGMARWYPRTSRAFPAGAKSGKR